VPMERKCFWRFGKFGNFLRLFFSCSSVFRKVAEKAPLHDQLRCNCTRFGPFLINHRHRSPPKKSVPAAALTQSRACRHSAALTHRAPIEDTPEEAPLKPHHTHNNKPPSPRSKHRAAALPHGQPAPHDSGLRLQRHQGL
jgi:hypothetical protein